MKETREILDIPKGGYIYTLVKLDKIELNLRKGRIPCFMNKKGFVLQSIIKLKRTK